MGPTAKQTSGGDIGRANDKAKGVKVAHSILRAESYSEMANNRCFEGAIHQFRSLFQKTHWQLTSTSCKPGQLT